MTQLAKLTSDELTRQAIAAATTDALAQLADVAAILLTRVETERKGPNRICASAVGWSGHLTKAQPRRIRIRPLMPHFMPSRYPARIPAFWQLQLG